MGAGAPTPQGQSQSMAPQSAPGKGGMPGGAPTADPQTQAQYQQGMPQQPQGLGALQNAYSQFQNSAPPQPNPMFGEQPNPAAQAPQVSNVLDAYMDVGQQPDHGPPGPEGYADGGQVGDSTFTFPSQASNFSQMRQEDPRMQAMRHMQRYRGGR